MYTLATIFAECVNVRHFDSLRDVSHALMLSVTARVKDPTDRGHILHDEIWNDDLVTAPVTVTYTDPEIGIPVIWHITGETELHTVLHQNELSGDVASHAFATETGAREFIDDEARKLFGMTHLGAENKVLKSDGKCLIIQHTDDKNKKHLISWEIIN